MYTHETGHEMMKLMVPHAGRLFKTIKGFMQAIDKCWMSGGFIQFRLLHVDFLKEIPMKE